MIELCIKYRIRPGQKQRGGGGGGGRDEEGEAYALVIKNALDADKEPKPDKIARSIECEEDGRVLVIRYTSSDLRLIRTASSGLLENLALVVDVINSLSPEANLT